jgi:type I restriction enzyme R subunit
MIADLKPYPEYKESGLPWLGLVPDHWSRERAKWLFTKMARPVGDADDVVTCFRDGIVTLRKNRRLRGFTEAIYELGYQGIRKGDLVIHAMDAFAGAVGVSDSDGKATPVYAVCQPKSGVNAHYYAFIVREMARSQWILALSRGIRERSTDFRYDTFGGQRVPLPPPDEQAAIVRFLDWANGRLERAIRAKRKVIALLNEQKQAIIHRAVTRGLDPSVSLRPSGIPWLGDIPRHWEVRRLKFVASRIVDCLHATPRYSKDGTHPAIRTADIEPGVVHLHKARKISPSDYARWTERLEPDEGDILYSREGDFGIGACVPAGVRLQAFKAYLAERKSPYQAIVAFSGEHEYGGAKVSETSLNGFPSGDIAAQIQTDPYRFLICADKFQTGYDEPLLHTMYVDKPLSGIKAVQTLSRLNRAHPQKHDCFVLDFQNNSEAITYAFQDYYRTTLLAEETDLNKLHDLKAALDAAQVYAPEQVQQVVELFLGGADRDKLDPILDACVAVYVDRLNEDQQVEFKGKAKVFCRTYSFLSSVIPYSNAEWEKLSILLDLLTPKLPAPPGGEPSGILKLIDMDSYRVEKKAAMKIALLDKDAEIEPVPTDAHGHKAEPELDRLSNILKTFNEQFGTLFTDTDRVAKRIRDDIAPKVAADADYQNAKENTPHTARMAHDQALGRVMQLLLKDDTQVYKQFVENESFKRFVGDMVYAITNQ